MDDLDQGLFDDGMIVEAADVIPVPPVVGVVHGGDSYGDTSRLTIHDSNDIEPSQSLVTPPELYDRVTAKVAPDGSPLTPNQIASPHLWRAGDPRQPGSGKKAKKANRINVRELVSKLSCDTMLDPIEVLFYIMNANEESRHHLGLRKSDRISANLRAKCAQELLTYMAPKLKSIEVKTDDGLGEKGTGIQIFLPKNEREHGAVAEQPELVLPTKDGVSIPFSPEIAAQLILNIESEDDENLPDWADV